MHSPDAARHAQASTVVNGLILTNYVAMNPTTISTTHHISQMNVKYLKQELKKGPPDRRPEACPG